MAIQHASSTCHSVPEARFIVNISSLALNLHPHISRSVTSGPLHSENAYLGVRIVFRTRCIFLCAEEKQGPISFFALSQLPKSGHSRLFRSIMEAPQYERFRFRIQFIYRKVSGYRYLR